MPVVSLLTDFGLADPYAGIMKGVIASICPEASVIDITHQISAQDVPQAGYVLVSAYPYFPINTIHVVVVDPGVGSGRRVVAVKTASGIFLAPDNGILTPVLEKQRVLAVFCVENPDIFIHPVSRTFHGRDIFAPAAGHLACGMHMEELGTSIRVESLVMLDSWAKPGLDENGRLCGAVIFVDGFGNLVLNLRAADIMEEFGTDALSGQYICIKAGSRVIRGISDSYSSVQKGEPLVVIGSTGLLEISVNQGSASRELQLDRKDRVTVMLCGELSY